MICYRREDMIFFSVVESETCREYGFTYTDIELFTGYTPDANADLDRCIYLCIYSIIATYNNIPNCMW